MKLKLDEVSNGTMYIKQWIDLQFPLISNS